MSEQPEQNGRPGDATATAVHLTVLPNSGKVDKLKDEFAAERNDPATPASHTSAAAAATGLPSIRTATDPGHAPATDPNAPPELKLLEGKVIEAIRQVYDPEIPVNIYELGLIYEIKVNEDRTVKVRMTLTAPACPVAGSLPGEVERRIEDIPEVKSAEVELVWDPPWHRGMMSEAAMLQLGML